MEEYEYKGYIITETPDGYYQTENFEFTSLDDAMGWVDEMTSEDENIINNPKPHTYLFFYIDRATDQAFEAKVIAEDLATAKKILRQNYDVYMITDYDILD